MKILTILYTLLTLSIFVAAQSTPQPPIQPQAQPFRLEPIASLTIPVTLDKMTNLVFPECIQSGVKVSAEIIAQKAHGVENVIEIKALRRHFNTTNLTVYGKDGQLYSFVLQYVDDTAALNFRILPTTRPNTETRPTIETPPAAPRPILLSAMPYTIPTLRDDAWTLEAQPQHHYCKVKTDHLTLRLIGIHAKDNLQWLTFTMTNYSPLDFNLETIRFYLQDRRQVRRRAVQETDLSPVFQDNPETFAPGNHSAFAAAFNPFHIAKGKLLICELLGSDGHFLTLKLSPRQARRALTRKKYKFLPFPAP
jgi:conjugative transposon TraN protein